MEIATRRRPPPTGVETSRSKLPRQGRLRGTLGSSLVQIRSRSRAVALSRATATISRPSARKLHCSSTSRLGHISARSAGRATPSMALRAFGHGLAGLDDAVESGALAFLAPLIAEGSAHLVGGRGGQEGVQVGLGLSGQRGVQLVSRDRGLGDTVGQEPLSEHLLHEGLDLIGADAGRGGAAADAVPAPAGVVAGGRRCGPRCRRPCAGGHSSAPHSGAAHRPANISHRQPADGHDVPAPAARPDAPEPVDAEPERRLDKVPVRAGDPPPHRVHARRQLPGR